MKTLAKMESMRWEAGKGVTSSQELSIIKLRSYWTFHSLLPTPWQHLSLMLVTIAVYSKILKDSKLIEFKRLHLLSQ